MKCLEQLVRKHICCSPTSWTLFNLPTEGAESWTTQSPWQHTLPTPIWKTGTPFLLAH